MRVDLLNTMGSDLEVVNAARVSFDKASELIDDKIQDRDIKLIRYLAEHGHWTPFTHCMATFRVTMPIYVARQLAKHQVGGSVNEVSRRYVSSAPVLDIPQWREAAQNVKQGSSNKPVFMDSAMTSMIDKTMRACESLYSDLLLSGVCPEQARAVLPLCTETTWIWTGSLYFFSRVCRLRLDPHAQRETADVAREISRHMAYEFPVSWEALK